MMKIIWARKSSQDIEYWKKKDRVKITKIKKLLDDIQLHPFTGIGKPEPLKGDFAGKWSRRISGEHRLVYEIQKNDIIIWQCRFHYHAH